MLAGRVHQARIQNGIQQIVSGVWVAVTSARIVLSARMRLVWRRRFATLVPRAHTVLAQRWVMSDNAQAVSQVPFQTRLGLAVCPCVSQAQLDIIPR